MKKTWTILCLAAVLTLPLAGCAGNRTGDDLGMNNGPSASPAPSQTVQPSAGQAEDSPLEDLGEGVRDTLDDMGSAARQVGRDARDAMDR